MSKNKKEPEKKTNPANQSQKPTARRNLPMGAGKRGGQSPK